jgi:hypothetical protein
MCSSILIAAIDIFVFCHCFHILSLKFLKFERVWNSAVKFLIAGNQKREIMKLNKIGTFITQSLAFWQGDQIGQNFTFWYIF